MVAEQPFRSTLDVTEMAEHIQRVGEQSYGTFGRGKESIVACIQERCWQSTCSVARHHSVEQKEKFKGKEQLASHAREYVAKVEGGEEGGGEEGQTPRRVGRGENPRRGHQKRTPKRPKGQKTKDNVRPCVLERLLALRLVH